MADHFLILGGQRSGKSRHAEAAAQLWLQRSPKHEGVLIATGEAHDDEMRARIARHRADRAQRIPALRTVEEARQLPEAIAAQSAAHRLLVVDCLTLWLTHLLMPMRGKGLADGAWAEQQTALCAVLRDAAGPVVLVSNEIGLGVIPSSPEARRFVDALGFLHQRVALECARVTLMVAGLPLAVKGAT